MSTLVVGLSDSQREIVVIDTYHTNERDCFVDELRLDTSDRFDEFLDDTDVRICSKAKTPFTGDCDKNEHNRIK